MAFLEEQSESGSRFRDMRESAGCALFIVPGYMRRETRSGFLFLDFANLMIHEFGHRLFHAGFGYTAMIWAGRWRADRSAACARIFFWKREIAGTRFARSGFF